jgi:hypothetical protein
LQIEFTDVRPLIANLPGLGFQQVHPTAYYLPEKPSMVSSRILHIDSYPAHFA